MNRWKIFRMTIGLCALIITPRCLGQAVDVTLVLDQPNLVVGQTTVLRVFGQVKPAETNGAQILSWYIDVLNDNGVVSQADYDNLSMASSDSQGLAWSSGTNDMANRRGIFNWFTLLNGAGKTNPVELVAVPVEAVAVGVAIFSVQAGTTQDLEHDFIVPAFVGDDLFGGDYSAAAATLTIVDRPSIDLSQVDRVAAEMWPTIRAVSSVVQRG